MRNIDIIHKASLRPIEATGYGSLTEAASRAMAGRTHYYDKDTLRYFGARVSRLHVDVDGIAMVALERLNADADGTRKGWRVTIHDLVGRQLHAGAFGATQRGLDTLLCNKRAADKEFRAACNALHPSSTDVLRDAVTAEIANHESALTALRGVQS